MSKWIYPIVVGALTACAAPSSEMDTISISTDPDGAHCVASRSGSVVAEIAQTPGSFQVSPGPEPISVTCSQFGYEDAEAVNRPASSEGQSSLAMGAPLYTYATQMRIALAPKQAPVSEGEKQQRVRMPRTGSADGEPILIRTP